MSKGTTVSRSYRKNHIVKDHNSGMKNIANRKVRHVPIEMTDTLQGGGYMRHFESWDISDWAFDGDWEDEEDKNTREWITTYRAK